MLTTFTPTEAHPFPYLRDCLESWDSLSQELKDKLVPLFGGQKFLDMIEEQRQFLRLVEAIKYN